MVQQRVQHPIRGMDVCVLRGRGLCSELITRAEESYGVCCVVVLSKNLVNDKAHWRLLCQKK
jgi:hypothetical protein